MPTTPNQPQPRRRPAPSPRDQQIYSDYQVRGSRQSDLATKYNLSQTRISQILRRVEHWLSQPHFPTQPASLSPQPLSPQPPSASSSLRLDRHLERERLTFICREALRQFQEQQSTTTHKTGTRNEKSFDETTTRSAPPNIQCLKVALQATRQLAALEDREPINDIIEGDEQQTRQHVEDWLTIQRKAAATAGHVAPHHAPRALVSDFINTLTGESNAGYSLHILAKDYHQQLVPQQLVPQQLVPHHSRHTNPTRHRIMQVLSGLVCEL